MSAPADEDHGLPQDAHLRAALQHAPDAALDAPAHVSALLIAAGYRAAAEPARPPVAAPPRRAWRVGASGAFATIALAGVLGLLWRGDPPSPFNDAAPASAPARVADTSAARAAATADRAVQAEAAARLPSPPPSPTAAAPADRPAAPVKATVEEPGAAPWRAGVAAPPAPAPAPAPAPVAAAAPLAAPASPTMSRSNGTARAMLAAPRPNAPWMDAVAAGAAVQWRVDGQLRTPASSWFYALAEQTQGRWMPATDTPRADERALQWREGDVILGRLWLGPERVLWCDAASRCQVAQLDEGVGPALLKALGP